MGAVLLSDQVAPDPQAVERAAAVLREGGVVVLPTDSVYGICCAAMAGNPAHARIFDIKRRDRSQTLPWFVADVCDLERYGRDVPTWALRLAERSWPGALTVVVRASEAVPPEYAQPSADGATIALRVPGSTEPSFAPLASRSRRRAPTRTGPRRRPRAPASSPASSRPPTS